MNLRKAFIVVAGGLATMLILIGLVSVAALSAFNDAREGVKQRQASLALVNEMRGEVDLLGRLVSSYVSTADPRFLIYYYDILAIREGSKPFPEGRSPAYWEQVMAGTQAYQTPNSGELRPLIERISRMGFDATERGLVRQIHQLTERMKQVEQVAFAATQGLYDPKRREFVSDGTPERVYANELLHGQAYLTVRAEMAVAIDRLAREVDERTARGLGEMASLIQGWIVAGIGLLLVTGLALIVSYRYLERNLLTPLFRLHGAAAALADKNYDVRVGDVAGVEEVKMLATTVDGMAAAIEADIRQREISEAALREAGHKAEVATEAKSIFLANMSHEIRTPMNAILGMAYLAMNSGLPPRQHDYVSKIHGAAASLLGIINDILDLSKVEAGKIDLEKQPFEVEAVVRNALFMIQQRAEERQIQLLLDYRLPPGFPMLEGDALRLGQVLINLLSNAVKFTEKGHVMLDVTEVPADQGRTAIRFSVEDTGIGMNAEQLGRLFKDFSQAEDSTARKYGGTGLGLSISRRLVQAMGGEIKVDSAPERGSRFYFRVAFSTASAAPPVSEVHHCQRVLVVDEYRPARESMASLFGLLPCPHVDSTGSAEDACERILEASRQGQGYDMLVLDSASRGMCLSDMRSALAEAGIAMPRQIVVVTASNAPALRADPMLSGIAEVIHKPLLPADLRRLCGELVPASEARQAAAVETHEALAGARFLLVEDNEINQQVASELLQSWGAAIDIAENGARGLECLLARESGYYAAVLMDLNMPVMDGIEATRRIRAEKRFAGLPVLALTAHAVGPELQQALKEGMNGHIAKPFEPAELLQRLRTYVVQKETGSGKPVAPGPSPALDEPGFVAKLSAIDEIDAEPLLRRFKGRMASLTRALKLFCKDAPGILAKLEASLADTDLEAARREAHTLKGLAGTFGMTALASAALDLELALKEGKAPEVQLLAVLGESLNAVIEKLAELFPELSFPQSPSQPVGLPPLSEQS